MSSLDWLQTLIAGSAGQVPVQIAWLSSMAADLPQDIHGVRQLCADGCPHYNRNGGCPPWSPTIDQLAKGKEITLLAVNANVSPDRNITELNDTIDAWMDQLGYEVLDALGISFLSAGPCRACPACTIETGCKKPERRVSSITGVGLLLSEILEHQFKQPLQWSKGEQPPERLTKVMGFVHRPGEREALSEFLRQHIKS